LGLEPLEALGGKGATEPELEGLVFGRSSWFGADAATGEEPAEELAVFCGGQFLDSEERFVHARRQVFGFSKKWGNGIDKGIIAGARLRQTRIFGEQVGLEGANELLEEARFEFVEKDTDLDCKAWSARSV
jgi:hypothetical protein